jgi:hypothetical protein
VAYTVAYIVADTVKRVLLGSGLYGKEDYQELFLFFCPDALRPAEDATGALVARDACFLSRGADAAPRPDFLFSFYFIFHVLPASCRVAPMPLTDLFIYLFIYLIFFIYLFISRFAYFLSRGADAAPRTVFFCLVLFCFSRSACPDLLCSGVCLIFFVTIMICVCDEH